MYAQRLKDLKRDKRNSISDLSLEKLGAWLEGMNGYKTQRIDYRVFARECDVEVEQAKDLFLAGVDTGLFRVFFEVRSDDNEYLDTIDQAAYDELLETGQLTVYSEELDSDIEVYVHHVKMWFTLLRPRTDD